MASDSPAPPSPETPRKGPALVRKLGSLRITVVLLSLSMVLIFVATLDQVNLGIHFVQEKYFKSFFALYAIPGLPNLHLPLPGGYLLGALIMVNLVCAYALRLKFTAKKAGILLVHGGLVLLILGQFFTGILQKETQMRLDEGQTSNYSESPTAAELAITDVTDPANEIVTVIPTALLKPGSELAPEALPFKLRVTQFFANSRVGMKGQTPNLPPTPEVNMGLGANVEVWAIPRAVKQDERDIPAVFLDITGKDGAPLGKWLASQFFDEAKASAPIFAQPQQFTHQGRTYRLDLRRVREYKPFQLTLVDFSHDRYAGTNIPKNFSSQVHLIDPAQGENRDVTIFMNNPLRYGGYTFYQASFANDDRTSILQVVRNPFWLTPYVACIMMGVGMTLQFAMHLIGYMGKRRKTRTTATPLLATAIPAALCVAILVGAAMPRKAKTEFDLRGFGELPVLLNGRVKPLDTVARTSLLIIQEKQTLRLPEKDELGRKKLSAIEWLAEVMFTPEKANDRPLFLVDNPDVLALLGHELGERKRFSFNELAGKLEEIDRQAEQAGQVKDAGQRTLFQKSILKLHEHVRLFHQLRNGIQAQGVEDLAQELAAIRPMREAGIKASQDLAVDAKNLNPEFSKFLGHAQPFFFQAQNAHFFAIPPLFPNGAPEDWRKVGDAVLKLHPSLRPDQFAPGVNEFGVMASAYRQGNAPSFNMALGDYSRWLEQTHPRIIKKSAAETYFNAFAPFYQCMILYVLGGTLALLSWLFWPASLGRAAYVTMLIGFGIHSMGLIFRMMLEGRPPVTNLYSSAIFIGWAVVLLGLFLERLHREGIGTFTAGCVGFITLLIAHHLSLAGDTLEMMQAVLDSNFWLATHVVIITLGYASTFLAGFLALVFIIGGLCTTALSKERSVALGRMVYGIICFAALFSLVGTILGGIWADQSWGRFWGWDPKENGALLIVLWNAVILHARWGGIARERGIMQMALFGNVVTSWSWFGTNMLGVGLHSYGFTGAAFYWLAGFAISQVAIIAIAAIPLKHWPSYRRRAREEAAKSTPPPAPNAAKPEKVMEPAI